MQNLDSIGKIFIFIGFFLVVIGIIFVFFTKISGVGKLPGDIYVEKKNFTFYFPLTSCIILSIIISVILWLLHRK